MNIVYYSSIFFSDCDFPLIRQYQQKGHNIQYYIEIVSGRYSGGLFNIKTLLPNHGIICAKDIPEFTIYKSYLNLDNVYLVIRTSKLLDILNWITYIKLIFKIRLFKSSVVHITHALGVSESLLYFFRKKMIMTVHDPFLHSGEESHRVEEKRRNTFRIASKLILLNKSQEEAFCSFYNVPYKKIYTNRLGVYECLEYLGSNSKNLFPEPYILFFGHFSPYKGIDVLCEAMTIVHKTHPNLKCVIAGKGQLNFDFTPYKNVGYIHLENRFIELDELGSLIKNSLFSVCPYKDATQSGVVFSSFALCKPVLASNVGGLGESVIDGVTGTLVEPNNPEKLAKKICDMVENKDVLVKLSKNIYEMFFSGEKSWGKIADKNIDIYRN